MKSKDAIIIIIYSFNVKLTSATFNNASTRYIINPKACKRKRLIVCPKAKNNYLLSKCIGHTLSLFEHYLVSLRDLRAPSADRCEILHRDRKCFCLYNPGPKFRGALSKKFKGQNMQHLVRFRMT